MYFVGASQLVLRPSNTNQVSDILKYCYNNDLAVVPQGGNTGLVGGSVPVFDEVVVSMERMHKIINVNSISGMFQWKWSRRKSAIINPFELICIATVNASSQSYALVAINV